VYRTRKDNDENFNYASLDKMILEKENYDKYETKYNLLVLRIKTHFVQSSLHLRACVIFTFDRVVLDKD